MFQREGATIRTGQVGIRQDNDQVLRGARHSEHISREGSE